MYAVTYTTVLIVCREKVANGNDLHVLAVVLKMQNVPCPNIQRDAPVLLKQDIVPPALLKSMGHIGSRKYMRVSSR